MALGRKYVVLISVLVVLVCAAVVLWFSHEHFMWREADVKVMVDGRPVAGTVYLGQPTYYESDAFTLVIVPGVGRYMVDFDDESYRDVSRFEYLPLGFGLWTLRSMQAGQFSKLLPFLHLNEFRIPASGGRVVTFID